MIFKIGSVVDISKPPLGPPLRKMKCSIFGDYWDIEGNKKELDAWHKYIEEYMEEFRNQPRISKDDSI